MRWGRFMKPHVINAMISFTVSLAVAILMMQCQSTVFKASPIEDLYEKSPELATYALCTRGAGEKKTTAGFNIKDCDVWKKRYLQKDELKTCVESLSASKDKKARMQAVCYLVIYQRKGDFLKGVKIFP